MKHFKPLPGEVDDCRAQVPVGGRKVFAKLCICILISVTGVQAGATELSADVPNISVGTGFDSQTYEARDDCILFNPDEVELQGGAWRTTNIAVVESSAEFKEYMGVSAEASVKAAYWEVGGKAAFANSVSVNDYSVFGVVRVEVLGSPKVLRNPVLKDRIVAQLQGENGVEDFKKSCGDEFVRSYRTGGELYGVIQVNTRSERQKRDATAALTGSVGIFSASGEVSAGSENFLRAYDKSVHVHMAGSSLETPTSLQRMIEVARQFAVNVEDDEGRNAVVVALDTYKYENLSAYREARPSGVEAALDTRLRQDRDIVIRELSDTLATVADTLASIRYALNNPEQFEQFDHGELQEYEAGLVALRDGEMREAAYACYSAYTGENQTAVLHPNCTVPQMPPSPDLPERLPYHGADDVFRSLQVTLGRSFDPDRWQRTRDGWTDLHYAVASREDEFVAFMLSGAGRNRNDVNGPLDRRGSFGGEVRIMYGDYLPLALSDFFAVGPRGQTALHLAACCATEPIVRMLIASGADPDARDTNGKSPLFYAARTGNEQAGIAELLIASGAVVNAMDDEGKTPLEVARERNVSELVEVLQERGGTDGVPGPSGRANAELDAMVPVGVVLPYFGEPGDLPPNWKTCDGTIVEDAQSPLNGKHVPDLVGKFVRGAESNEDLGTDGGSAKVPAHGHRTNDLGVRIPRRDLRFRSVIRSQRSDALKTGHSHTGTASVTGSTDQARAVDNQPPFVNLHYIIKIKCGPLARKLEYPGCVITSAVDDVVAPHDGDSDTS